MDRLSFRKIHYAPTGVSKTLAPVNIFAIHEKCFIQKADLVQRIPPNHPEPSVQNIDRSDLVTFEVRHGITAKYFRTGENDIECQRSTKAAPQSWFAPIRASSLPRRSQHAGSEHPHLGMRFHVTEHFVDAAGQNANIGIN